MNVATLGERLADYVMASPDNAIQESYALRDEIVGTPLFDALSLEHGKDYQACWLYL